MELNKINKIMIDTELIQEIDAKETKFGAQQKVNIHSTTIATAASLGHVRPDGTTIKIDSNGVISSIGGVFEKDVIVYPTDTASQIYTKLTTATKSVYFSQGTYTLNGSNLSNRIISIQQPIKIFSENATIYLERGAQFELKSEGIDIYGIQFRVRNTGTLVGGEACLLVRRSNIKIERCFMGGSQYYHGILIENRTETGFHCNDVRIVENEFDTLGFGVLKQGWDSTKAHRLYIHKNKFRNIVKGDAIEINTGGDKDFHITYNDIDGVLSGGIENAGFAIGVAGHGLYTDNDYEKKAGNFTISHNIIKNAESEGVHLEKSSNGLIFNNQIMNCETGIIAYGSQSIAIENNTISNIHRGIVDGLGVENNAYVPSSSNNTIKNNHISNASIMGIISESTGELITSYILNNTIIDSEGGIGYSGRSIVHIKDNLIVDCDIPLYFDYESLVAQAIDNKKYRNINITGNTTIYKGIVADNGKAYLKLINYDNFIFENNTFKLGTFTRQPSVFTENVNEPLYFVKGDILNTVNEDNTITQSLVTKNGFKPVSVAFHFAATQGNDSFHIVSGGDPADYFKPGQLVRLPNAGAGGTELIAMIEYFYIASSLYRVKISAIIGSTVAATPLHLTETATLTQRETGGSGSSGQNIIVSNTAPTSLTTGGLWYQVL